ncbi:hypothetical protein FNV43_RR23953 [Rhamnella rubrinervis]|uniref:protein-serine/threonine phosphatase n=1 Tax=Rhamnella rubrinervis TaxID=2594499 RepID=A0A8K0GPT4_9ROSA|nr:hypothetical protein FNV43_RR23953 [Rhamnella rubrinervis]
MTSRDHKWDHPTQYLSPNRITNRFITAPRVSVVILAVHVSFEKSKSVVRKIPSGANLTDLKRSTVEIRYFSFSFLYRESAAAPKASSTLCTFVSQLSRTMRTNPNPHPTPENDLRRSRRDSGDVSQVSIIKTKNARRKKLKFRQLKYTCRSKVHVSFTGAKFGNSSGSDDLVNNNESEKMQRDDAPMRISVSLSPSEDDIVLSSFAEESPQGSDCSGRCYRGQYGVLSVIGRRKEMEDAVRAELGFAVKGSEEYDFFAVYDGHGGSYVANACRERLHEMVAEEVEGRGENEVDWEKLMEGCFSKMDEAVSCVASARTVGSTAVVAVGTVEDLVVANCGDCRAVLSRAGVALPLSTDHKPYRPDELMRIEAAGGRVINWNGHRVLGVLATSRSIGDLYLRPYVISKPEVTVTKRSDEDEFLILASDGLWDVISNQVACKVVKKCLEGKMRRIISKEVVNESRTSEAAAVLAELAMARGSKDNISVIVVELRKSS